MGELNFTWILHHITVNLELSFLHSFPCLFLWTPSTQNDSCTCSSTPWTLQAPANKSPTDPTTGVGRAEAWRHRGRADTRVTGSCSKSRVNLSSSAPVPPQPHQNQAAQGLLLQNCPQHPFTAHTGSNTNLHRIIWLRLRVNGTETLPTEPKNTACST